MGYLDERFIILLKLDLDPNDVQPPHGETKSRTWTRLHSLSKTSSISSSLVVQLQGILKKCDNQTCFLSCDNSTLDKSYPREVDGVGCMLHHQTKEIKRLCCKM